MAYKEKKTREQLTELLTAEIRKHPECNHVISVAITRPLTQDWDTAFTVDGNEIVCLIAFAIARDLQTKYDLA